MSERAQLDRVAARSGVIAGLTFAAVIVALILAALIFRGGLEVYHNVQETKVSPAFYARAEKAAASLKEAYAHSAVASVPYSEKNAASMSAFEAPYGVAIDTISEMEIRQHTAAEKELTQFLRSYSETLNVCAVTGGGSCAKYAPLSTLDEQMTIHKPR